MTDSHEPRTAPFRRHVVADGQPRVCAIDGFAWPCDTALAVHVIDALKGEAAARSSALLEWLRLRFRAMWPLKEERATLRAALDALDQARTALAGQEDAT